MSDETEHQELIYNRILETVNTLNELLKEAEDAALSITVTFPLKSDTARVSVSIEPT